MDIDEVFALLTRVDLITDSGRVMSCGYNFETRTYDKEITFVIQDDGRTMKIFVKDRDAE